MNALVFACQAETISGTPLIGGKYFLTLMGPAGQGPAAEDADHEAGAGAQQDVQPLQHPEDLRGLLPRRLQA